jgi:hypothetical protein
LLLHCSFGDCDNNTYNGCEVNLNTDAAHCGSCATPAAPFANAAPACVNGASALGICNQG